ncbi:TRAP transporter small permease [Marinomonas posidonica]|uniref:TRAP transporter small permease n=1 Tax=Marinomonas posidonica TaxID=936476 RepID=UPI0037366A95
MSSFERILKKLTMGIGVFILGVMPAVIVADVAMRNLFDGGFPATIELVSRYFILVISFLPIAYAEVKRRHIEASILTDRLPNSSQPFIHFLGFILSFFVYVALTWGTILEAYHQTQSNAYIEAGTAIFYVWPGYWILPICYGLMVLVLVMRLVQVVTGRFNQESA